MYCNFNRTLLQEYLDRETGPLENLLLEEHLRACPGCRAEMEQLLVLFRDLEDPPQTSPPENLAMIRKNTIDRYLDGHTGITAGNEKSITASGTNLGSILSAIWQGQAVWANQTVTFVKYLPEARTTRNASEIIKKSGRMAGKAMFSTAKKLAMAAASRRA